MCFSATASFAAATATGITGAIVAGRVASYREVPLGSIPLVFAIQQAIEGSLWLTLDNYWPRSLEPLLANGFVTIALVVWPLLAPVALLLIEPDARRRLGMTLLLLAGLLVAGYSVVDIIHHPYSAAATGGSLCYVNNSPFPPSLFVLYVAATCSPALLSSHPSLRLFGIVVLAGGIVAAAAFVVVFVSVGCFFAATASIVIAVHFAQRARQPIESPLSA